MGIFDWFKKKEEVIEEKEQEEIKEIINQEHPDRKYCNEACVICLEIIGYDRWKKIQGKYHHKLCFKRQMNKVRDGGI